jgi:predicted Zn-dependent protease
MTAPGWKARGFARALAVYLIVAVSALATAPANAQYLIRDAEIERSLRELARPMINASGLSSRSIRLYVLADDTPNAFVTNSNTIFVHSGLLLKLSTPEQVQAVLAHEVAHIANGHLSRRAINFKDMQRRQTFALALGVAAGVAAGDAGVGAGIGAAVAGASLNSFLGHTRAEEAAADISAIRYMKYGGVDPAAMLDVFDMFRGQEMLVPERQSGYARSHPLTRDRIRSVEAYVDANKPKKKAGPENAYWYARLQGKLSSFLRSPSWTFNRVKAGDNSEVARMRRAVAYLKMPDPENAIAEADALVAMRPEDPYYQELKAQIHFETRRFPQAVVEYERALELAPNQPLILAAYGRALLALKSDEGNEKALAALEKAYRRDSRNPDLLRDLARAYALEGDDGKASLMTAKRYSLMGRKRDAAIHARRAVGLLPNGSPGHRQASDILAAAKKGEKRK